MSLLVLMRVTPELYQLRRAAPVTGEPLHASFETLRIVDHMRQLPIVPVISVPPLHPREMQILRIGRDTYFMQPWARARASGRAYSLSGAAALLYDIARRDLLGRANGLVL